MIGRFSGIVGLAAATAVLGAPAARAVPRDGDQLKMVATAYSVEGKTADGTRSREGVVAADPDLLPLGSRIRIEGAGRYDGEYVVEDTGPAIKGHEVDIYIRDDAEAKAFGRKRVKVQVLARGEGAGARRSTAQD